MKITLFMYYKDVIHKNFQGLVFFVKTVWWLTLYWVSSLYKPLLSNNWASWRSVWVLVLSRWTKTVLGMCFCRYLLGMVGRNLSMSTFYFTSNLFAKASTFVYIAPFALFLESLFSAFMYTEYHVKKFFQTTVFGHCHNSSRYTGNELNLKYSFQHYCSTS